MLSTITYYSSAVGPEVLVKSQGAKNMVFEAATMRLAPARNGRQSSKCRACFGHTIVHDGFEAKRVYCNIIFECKIPEFISILSLSICTRFRHRRRGPHLARLISPTFSGTAIYRCQADVLTLNRHYQCSLFIAALIAMSIMRWTDVRTQG